MLSEKLNDDCRVALPRCSSRKIYMNIENLMAEEGPLVASNRNRPVRDRHAGVANGLQEQVSVPVPA